MEASLLQRAGLMGELEGSTVLQKAGSCMEMRGQAVERTEGEAQRCLQSERPPAQTLRQEHSQYSALHRSGSDEAGRGSKQAGRRLRPRSPTPDQFLAVHGSRVNEDRGTCEGQCRLIPTDRKSRL